MLKAVLRRISCFNVLLFVFLFSSISGYAIENNEYMFTDVKQDKVWKVKFNKAVDKDYLKKVQVKLTDERGIDTYLSMSIGDNDKTVLVNPPTSGYEEGCSYEINIPTGLKSKNGKILKKISTIKFSVAEKIKIKGIVQERTPFVVGEDMNFYIYSNTDKMVQYNIRVTDSNGKSHDITDGFSKGIKGNSTHRIKMDNLSSGDYLLNVYMRIVGEKEIHNSNGIGYSDKFERMFTVNKKSSKYDFLIEDIKFESPYVISECRYILQENETMLKPSIGGKSDFKYNLTVIDVESGKTDKNVVKYEEKFRWSPKYSREFLLEIGIKSSKGDYLGSKVINVVTENITIKYVDYNMTIDEFAKMEMNNERMIIYAGNGYWRTPTLDEVKYYLNPENFMDDYGIYQFLVLNYVEGMTVDEVNDILKGKGILEGKGAALLEGAKKYDINPAYLIAHIILETGHGKVSELAKGIEVTSVKGESVDPRIVYNMYGIQATDANPNKYGSEYAYKQGWFTPEIAIIEGAKWVGENYINSDKFDQNTLYEMRWNKSVLWHQFSTDVKWPYGQIKRIKEYLEKSENIKLVFEIPRYKK